MIPSSNANSMLHPHMPCAGQELRVWNTTAKYRHGFAFVRKEWTRRRAEIVME